MGIEKGYDYRMYGVAPSRRKRGVLDAANSNGDDLPLDVSINNTPGDSLNINIEVK